MAANQQIESLQVLRAFAFLAVFISHCHVINDDGQLGALSVSIFFVLSGFLMAYNYGQRNLDYDIKSCLSFSINKIK